MTSVTSFYFPGPGIFTKTEKPILATGNGICFIFGELDERSMKITVYFQFSEEENIPFQRETSFVL